MVVAIDVTYGPPTNIDIVPVNVNTDDTNTTLEFKNKYIDKGEFYCCIKAYSKRI